MDSSALNRQTQIYVPVFLSTITCALACEVMKAHLCAVTQNTCLLSYLLITTFTAESPGERIFKIR